MKRIFAVLMLGISLNSYAQILKEHNIVLADSSVLSYLTNQDKFSGLYTIRKGDVELLRGNYVDGKRVGNWYFFNYDKSVFLRYNYDNKKMLFVDAKTLALASVEVKADQDVVKQGASVAVPLFSLEQYLVLVSRAAKTAIPNDQRSKLNNKDVEFVANVSKDGSAQYSVRYVLKGQTKEVKVDLGNKFDIEWLPASYSGQFYESTFVVKSKLSFEKDPDHHRRINWY